MSRSDGKLPWLEHFTPFTQPIQFYTELHCSYLEKTLNELSGRLLRGEHPFLMLGEQQEDALQDQRSQLNHCPCPKCYINLLHLFFKAGHISTNPGHQLLQPAHPCEGGLQLLTPLLGLPPPAGKALQLASWFSHHLQYSSWVILPTAPIVWRLK